MIKKSVFRPKRSIERPKSQWNDQKTTSFDKKSDDQQINPMTKKSIVCQKQSSDQVCVVRFRRLVKLGVLLQRVYFGRTLNCGLIFGFCVEFMVFGRIADLW